MAPIFFTLAHALFLGCFIGTAHCSLQISRNFISNNAVQNDAPPETWFQVTGLTVVSVYGARAEVKWVKSTGPVFGYELRVCTKWMPRECQKTDIGTAGEQLQNLKPNTTYQVRVRPFDNSKPPIYGEQVVVEFTTRPFPIVHDLKATARGSRSIQVTWTAPHEEVIGYKVYGYSEGGSSVAVNTSDTSVTLFKLSPQKTYAIQVTVLKNEGDELSSGVPVTVSATTTALRAPTNVQLKATCDHRILASWNYVGDPLTGFELKLCEDKQQSCLKKTASPEERNVEFNITPRESTFTFSIQSSVQTFGGHLSEAVVKNSRSLRKAPLIEDFDVHPVGNKTLEVSWKAVQGGQIGIEVCRASSPTSQCTYHNSDGNVSKYWIRGLEEGTEYTISASFRPTAEGPVCLYEKTVQNVTLPSQGAPGNSAASLFTLNGFLMLSPLLYIVLRRP